MLPPGHRDRGFDCPGRSSDGFATVGGQPFSGLASQVYDLARPERMHLRFRFRDGLKDGPADGWDEERNRIYGALYEKGQLVPGSESWNGKGELAPFLALKSSGLILVHFPHSPPTMGEGQTHLLGTSSKGYDVLAYLFGGLQVNFKAALVYIPLVYALGISIGLLMGFFGGAFDLIVQRLIEILSNIPFLFVVMIASTAIPEGLKETAGLWIIIGILLLFGWMGMTYLMRTAALKEKARDYIAASRVIGASTPRISLPSPPSQLGGDYRDLGSVFHFQPRACSDLSGLPRLWFAREIRNLGTAFAGRTGESFRSWLVTSAFLFWLVCLSSSPSWGGRAGGLRPEEIQLLPLR